MSCLMTTLYQTVLHDGVMQSFCVMVRHKGVDSNDNDVI